MIIHLEAATGELGTDQLCEFGTVVASKRRINGVELEDPCWPCHSYGIRNRGDVDQRPGDKLHAKLLKV